MPGPKFIQDNDASELSGITFPQVIDGLERVIAYLSNSMNVHERTYCITRKDLLAVVIA